MKARAALALLAVGASLHAVPAGAGTSPVLQTWWVHRTAARPVSFAMTVTARVREASDANEGMLFTLRMVPPSVYPGRFADYSVGGVGREPVARTYGIGAGPPACDDPCDTLNATGLFDATGIDERSPLDSEWYVAAYDLDVTIAVSRGWRVDRIANRLTVVTGAAPGATGVRTNNVTVERFTQAKATGGRYGSMAFAVIPCTSAGIGSATLRGGRSYYDGAPLRPLTCASYEDALEPAVAYGATTWSLAGDVTGWTSWPVRLLTFSLPHRYG